MADLPVLTTIARAAKAHWGYPEEWLRIWDEELRITEEDLARLQVFVATDGAEVVGMCALDGTGQELALEHVWVRPEAHGRGVGASLFAHAVGVARAMGAARIVVTSDPNAEGFYLRMGATRIGAVGAAMPGAADRQLPQLAFDLE